MLPLAACGGGSQQRPPQEHATVIVEPLQPPIAYTPHVLAARYNDTATAGENRQTQITQVVAEELIDHAKQRSSLTIDDRLVDVARELAVIVAKGEPVSRELLTFALHARGVVEPAVTVLWSRQRPTGEIAADLDRQLERIDLPNAARVGVAGDDAMVVVITRSEPVALDPFPRSLPHAGAVEVTGLAPVTLESISAHLTDDSGAISEALPVRRDASGRFTVQVACGERDEVRWLALEAVPIGSFALLPIYCGVATPSTYWIEPRANVTTADPARRLIAMINRERMRAGLHPLAYEPRAGAAAREHASSMSTSATAGAATPAERLRRAGLVAQLVSFAALDFDDLQGSSEVLMNNARYRSQLLEPELNEVAAGASRGRDGSLNLAIYYLRTVPRIDPAQFTDTVIARLRRHPKASPTLIVDTALSQRARTFANASALGWTQETIAQAYKALIDVELPELEWRTGSIIDPAKLDVGTLISDLPFDLVAVGVAQSSDAGPLAGRIWIVVISGCQKSRNNQHKRTCVRRPVAQ